MTVHVQQVHGAVVLSGGVENLEVMRDQLQHDFRCYHYRDNALLVEDVTEEELSNLSRFAETNECWVDSVHNTHKVRIAMDDEQPEQPKQPDLSVLADGWYKTNQETFPLIHVITVRNEVDGDGILLWLFDVDLVGNDALPQQATLDAQQLKGYNPKPAAIADFDDLDITPPADFTGAPHVIPTVEEGDESQKTAGVPLPQAQIAAQQLQQRLGFQYVRAEVKPAKEGFVVQAKLFGRPPFNPPDEIGGAPVKYLR